MTPAAWWLSAVIVGGVIVLVWLVAAEVKYRRWMRHTDEALEQAQDRHPGGRRLGPPPEWLD